MGVVEAAMCRVIRRIVHVVADSSALMMGISLLVSKVRVLMAISVTIKTMFIAHKLTAVSNLLLVMIRSQQTLVVEVWLMDLGFSVTSVLIMRRYLTKAIMVLLCHNMSILVKELVM